MLDSLVPPIGSPGTDDPVSFSGLSVPTQPGQYSVVAAEEPYADAILAFEASADLARVPIGTLTATPSSTVWGPLLPFQTWDQSGPIAYGSASTSTIIARWIGHGRAQPHRMRGHGERGVGVLLALADQSVVQRRRRLHVQCGDGLGGAHRMPMR